MVAWVFGVGSSDGTERKGFTDQSLASKAGFWGSYLRREPMGSMALGLRDGYSGGGAKGFRGDVQGGVDSVLSSCKGRDLDGKDGGFFRLSNLIKGKLRILLGYL